MSFTLYHYYLCPYCKPIYYFVKSNKLNHKEVHLDLRKAEHRTPEYLAINPFGKVPAVVEEDGFVLFESSTVLRYLCNTREVPDNWYSKDPKKRSQVDLFFDWYQVGSKGLTKYYISRNPFLYKQMSVSLEEGNTESEKSLSEIEKIFLKDRKFLAGDEISLADIQLIFFFGNLENSEFDLSKFPVAKEWKERVLSTDIKEDYDNYVREAKKKVLELKAESENEKK